MNAFNQTQTLFTSRINAIIEAKYYGMITAEFIHVKFQSENNINYILEFYIIILNFKILYNNSFDFICFLTFQTNDKYVADMITVTRTSTLELNGLRLASWFDVYPQFTPTF